VSEASVPTATRAEKTSRRIERHASVDATRFETSGTTTLRRAAALSLSCVFLRGGLVEFVRVQRHGADRRRAFSFSSSSVEGIPQECAFRRSSVDGSSVQFQFGRVNWGEELFSSAQFTVVEFGLVRFALVWFGLVWFALVRYGLVRYGLVWFALVWFALVWFAPGWFLFVQFAVVQSSSVRCGSV
jgi:hypothetical protein